MKAKSIILSIVLSFVLLMPFGLQGQVYYPFPDSAAVWKVIHYPYPPGPMPAYALHYDNYPFGDTIINDVEYIKLFQLGFDPDCSLITYGPYYTGAYRNDTINRRVYFISESHANEDLLYDFSLEVGDTVPQTYINYAYPHLVVDSIDSILLGDHYRKRFYYYRETWPPIEVVEGMGAHTGLLEPMEIFEHQHYLRCFHLNDELLYIYNADSCSLETDTCLSVNITDPQQKDFNVTLFPNPVVDNLSVNIECMDSKTLEFRFFLLNSSGIIQKDIGFKINNKTISLQDLPSGLYLWYVLKENILIASGKLAKI
ncbi:MAG: hypothetical protein HQ565_05100 [Bacteroidetes bacterium]|nr:hypothetical protein [Bacteroidota bacterium]